MCVRGREGEISDVFNETTMAGAIVRLRSKAVWVSDAIVIIEVLLVY